MFPCLNLFKAIIEICAMSKWLIKNEMKTKKFKLEIKILYFSFVSCKASLPSNTKILLILFVGGHPPNIILQFVTFYESRGAPRTIWDGAWGFQQSCHLAVVPEQSLIYVLVLSKILVKNQLLNLTIYYYWRAEAPLPEGSSTCCVTLLHHP